MFIQILVVVVVEEVLELRGGLRLNEISPITNKYIKLAIAYEKGHVKNQRRRERDGRSDQ